MTKLKLELDTDRNIDQIVINLLSGGAVVEYRRSSGSANEETNEAPVVVKDTEQPKVEESRPVIKHQGFDPDMFAIINGE